MNPKNNNPLDDFFHDQFQTWKKTPEQKSWFSIEQQMEDDSLDQVYRESMKGFEVMPSEKNWEQIEPALPFHLRIRRQLQKLSQVAAILLILMMAFTIYNRIEVVAASVVADATPVFETPELDPTVAQQDYVLAIEDHQEGHNVEVNLLKEEAIKTELEELLALVIEEEDSFEQELDKVKLKEILQPLAPLPTESLTSSTNVVKKKNSINQSTPQEQDLKIMIPLKVVEEHEIERFLDIYEQQNKTSKEKSDQSH